MPDPIPELLRTDAGPGAPTPGTGPVLVTGSSGNLGRAALVALAAAGRRTIGIDLRPPVENAPRPDAHHTGTLDDAALIARAVRGCDAVLHLAGITHPRETWADTVRVNVDGLHHTLHAAAAAGVRRFVYASTGQVARGESHRPLTVRDRRPTNRYAVSKAWGEDLGRLAAAGHLPPPAAGPPAEPPGPIAFLAVRIGWTPPNPGNADLIRDHPEGPDMYLSHGDAGRFFAAALAPGARRLPDNFAIVNLTGPGRGNRRMYDLTEAKDLVGYEPQDPFPAGLNFDYLGRAPASPNPAPRRIDRRP